MLRFVSYDIVFQEIPGEVTLAVNISGCPNHCAGCHSPHLWDNTGERLDDDAVAALLGKYGSSVTCFCFMGGDAEPGEVARLASLVRTQTSGRLKIGWYSGKSALPDGFGLRDFDYIKLGPYITALGGLDCETTNQRFYKVQNGSLTDITPVFKKSKG